jgi:hypothetical protein
MPAIGYLRTFDCLAYVKGLNAVGKLGDRSTPGVFIGYAEGAKAYGILNLTTRCVHTAWDVIFVEGRGWDWSKVTNDSATSSLGEFTVDYMQHEGFRGAGDSPSTSGSPGPEPRTPSPVPTVRNKILTLIEREDDTKSWGNILIYFSHNVMPT